MNLPDTLDKLTPQQPAWMQEFIQYIDACIESSSDLNDWEQEFILSLKRQVSLGRTLSPKQINKLTSIYESLDAPEEDPDDESDSRMTHDELDDRD